MLKILIGTDILLAALFALQYRHMPEQLPILYSRPWGEAQIVDYWYIMILPGLMHLFFFLNIYLSKRFFFHEVIPQKIFSIANIVFTITFAIIFIRILFLVT